MKFIKQAVSVSGITLASRILGMVRDALIAFVFGATLASDAFFIAFRPFDLARKMMADGILTISFIPVFARVLQQEGKKQAVSMFWSACVLGSAAAAVIAAVGIYAAPVVVRVLAPGYALGTYAHALSVVLLKMMMPYMLFICLTALSMGVLNCLGYFAVAAATPIILNACIIAFALVLAEHVSVPITVLAAGVTAGGLLQLAFQLPWLGRAGMLKKLRFAALHPGVVQALKRLVPSVIGAASFQVNMLVAGILASMLVPGAVSCLYYAERLVQFPLALFAASVATVFLPMLSSQAALRDMDGLRRAFDTGVQLVFFLTIPAMAGIMALSRPIVSLLFERGAFEGAAAAQAGSCLFWLVTGLWAMAGTRLYTTFHFALSNIRLPFWAGLVSIGINGVLGWILGSILGVAGLAMAVALSSAAGFFCVCVGSPVKTGLKSLFVCTCRAVFISVIMSFCVRSFWEVWVSWMPGTTLMRGVGLMLAVGAGITIFFSGAMVLARREFDTFKKAVFKHQ